MAIPNQFGFPVLQVKAWKVNYHCDLSSLSDWINNRKLNSKHSFYGALILEVLPGTHKVKKQEWYCLHGCECKHPSQHVSHWFQIFLNEYSGFSLLKEPARTVAIQGFTCFPNVSDSHHNSESDDRSEHKNKIVELVAIIN